MLFLLLEEAYISGQYSKIPSSPLEKPELTPTQLPISTAIPTAIQITDTPISISEAVLTPEITRQVKSDKDLITEAFVDKYGKSINKINVVITDNRSKNASGNVSFEGEAGGGMQEKMIKKMGYSI